MQEGKAAAGPKAIGCRGEEWERSAHVLGGGVVARAAHVQLRSQVLELLQRHLISAHVCASAGAERAQTRRASRSR